MLEILKTGLSYSDGLHIEHDLLERAFPLRQPCCTCICESTYEVTYGEHLGELAETRSSGISVLDADPRAWFPTQCEVLAGSPGRARGMRVVLSSIPIKTPTCEIWSYVSITQIPRV